MRTSRVRVWGILYTRGRDSDKQANLFLWCRSGRSGSFDSGGISPVWFSCSSNQWMTEHTLQMTALSSCSKARLHLGNPWQKTYHRVKAIIQQFLPWPLEEGYWVDWERKRLSWIISISKWSVSSILAVTVYVWFSTVGDKPTTYPGTL